MRQIDLFLKTQLKEQSQKQNPGESPDEILHHFKLKKMNRLAMGHLNINSLLNMFEILKLLVKNSLDIFIISDTKLDETFPEGSCGWVYHTMYDTNLV